MSEVKNESIKAFYDYVQAVIAEYPLFQADVAWVMVKEESCFNGVEFYSVFHFGIFFFSNQCSFISRHNSKAAVLEMIRDYAGMSYPPASLESTKVLPSKSE